MRPIDKAQSSPFSVVGREELSARKKKKDWKTTPLRSTSFILSKQPSLVKRFYLSTLNMLSTIESGHALSTPVAGFRDEGFVWGWLSPRLGWHFDPVSTIISTTYSLLLLLLLPLLLLLLQRLWFIHCKLELCSDGNAYCRFFWWPITALRHVSFPLATSAGTNRHGLEFRLQFSSFCKVFVGGDIYTIPGPSLNGTINLRGCVIPGFAVLSNLLLLPIKKLYSPLVQKKL